MSSLILKRAPFDPNREDYNVLEDGVIVGRIFLSPAAPQDRPWMWASGHNGDIRRAAHGYEATREQAMAAFKRSWHREGRIMPTSFINDPEHWLDRAKEARTLADQMNDEGAKQAMLRIAADYERLAERAAERARGGKQ